MADYITLLGAEDVRHAANTMQNAADRMNHAASTIDDTLFRHQQAMAEINRQHQEWMDEWLDRFKDIVTGSDMPAPAAPDPDKFPHHPMEPPLGGSNGPEPYPPLKLGDGDDDIPF